LWAIRELGRRRDFAAAALYDIQRGQILLDGVDIGCSIAGIAEAVRDCAAGSIFVQADD